MGNAVTTEMNEGYSLVTVWQDEATAVTVKGTEHLIVLQQQEDCIHIGRMDLNMLIKALKSV